MAEGIAKEAIKKIDSKLECSICLEPYKEPKLLPCFHAFCKSPCLEKLVKHDHQGTASLCCPICRCLVTLSEKGVASLQSNFHIDHLVEIREFLDKAQATTKAQCEKCAKAPAEGFCCDCQKLVCAKCTEMHSMWVEIADHKIVSLAQATAEASKMISPTDKVLYCPRHTKTALKLFCSTCSELICMDCTVRLHKDHSYDLVDDLFPQCKDEIADGLKPVRQNIAKVKQALKEFDTSAKVIDDERGRVEADIHREIDDLHQFLDQRRRELIGELEMLTQQKRKSLAAQRDAVEVTLAKHTSCVEYAEGGLETGSPAEVVAMRGAVLKRISEITTEFDPTTIQHEAGAPVVFVGDVKEEVKRAYGVGIATIKLSTHELNGSMTGKQVETTFQLMSQNQKLSVACGVNVNVDAELLHTASQAKSNVEIDIQEHTLSFTPTLRGRHELGVSVNGQAVPGSPFPLSAAPDPASLGKPVRVIEGLNGPWGVAINGKGYVIATECDSHQVSVYDKEGKQKDKEWRKIRSFGGRGDGPGQFNQPCGVTVDEDDNVYVADNGNRRLQKFTSEGVFIASVDIRSNGQISGYPKGVGYNKTNRKIYITSNHKVHVLNTDLTCYTAFGKQGKSVGELNCPFGVSFDRAGNVYVADFGNNRVQVFSADGEFVRKLDNCDHPVGIAIGPCTDVVYVTEGKGNRISLFTTAGEHIRSLGNEGRGDGQFDSPAGIVTDKDENIIVADSNNSRLQIL